RIPRFARCYARASAPSWSTKRRICVRSSMHWSKRSRRRTVPFTFAGDDGQAIYGWRGGDVTRLHAFERTYRGGTVLAVGRNYRSTPEIVPTAARLIGHNRARRPKPLAAVRP